LIKNFKRVLVLSPHTDDLEFGCGATVAQMCALGMQVKSIAFSAAEESVPPGFSKDILRVEFEAAQQYLGIPSRDRQVLDFKVRYFPRDRQEILEVLVGINCEYKPDLVLAPSVDDTHQDHKTLAEETFRAFKRTTIWAYEAPWNQLVCRVNCFVKISEADLERKISAIQLYESQKHRSYSDRTFVTSLAAIRGAQVGVPLSEAFEIVRQVAF
jgi:N-acetylglucosamine malate deacetylase 1